MPDTDVEVEVEVEVEVDLYEIRADGTSIYLTQDVQRARYRESLREAHLVKPGFINFYTSSFFSRTIQRGCRLRLVLRSPDPLDYARNYNGGGNPMAESGKDEVV